MRPDSGDFGIIETGTWGVFIDDDLVNVEWVAWSEDGDVYTLLPASPTAGQTWTNMVDSHDLRELEVLSVDATSPNGIDGCVAIRETSPDDWSDILWFKDGVIVAMQWEDIAGSDPDEVYYPIDD